jgi:hypothetical protein
VTEGREFPRAEGSAEAGFLPRSGELRPPQYGERKLASGSALPVNVPRHLGPGRQFVAVNRTAGKESLPGQADALITLAGTQIYRRNPDSTDCTGGLVVVQAKLCPSDVAGGFPWPRQKPIRRMQKWPFFDWLVSPSSLCRTRASQPGMRLLARQSGFRFDDSFLQPRLPCVASPRVKMPDSSRLVALVLDLLFCRASRLSRRDWPETGWTGQATCCRLKAGVILQLRAVP